MVHVGRHRNTRGEEAALCLHVCTTAYGLSLSSHTIENVITTLPEKPWHSRDTCTWVILQKLITTVHVITANITNFIVVHVLQRTNGTLSKHFGPYTFFSWNWTQLSTTENIHSLFSVVLSWCFVLTEDVLQTETFTPRSSIGSLKYKLYHNKFHKISWIHKYI